MREEIIAGICGTVGSKEIRKEKQERGNEVFKNLLIIYTTINSIAEDPRLQ